jgi:hypothetical protein
MSQWFIAWAAPPPMGRLSRLMVTAWASPAAWAARRNLSTATSAYVSSATGTGRQ